MKIEMGESLMYSWMRHVKGCTIVQTNWKVSPLWNFLEDSIKENSKYLIQLLQEISTIIHSESNVDIFNDVNNFEQIIHQGECDVLGVDLSGDENTIYAADVAFHRYGLGYSNNVKKVTEKVIRTAFCVYLATGKRRAEIIFASPYIRKTDYTKISNSISKVQQFFKNKKFDYTFSLIANNDFKMDILEPVLLMSNSIDDTSELFLRSQQLIALFNYNNSKSTLRTGSLQNGKASIKTTTTAAPTILKIGILARVFFTKFAEEGKLSVEEVKNLETKEYSKDVLGLNFPCLVKEGTEFNTLRYYTTPIDIREKKYYLCSQWFETNRNKLENWIDLICNKS